MRNKVTQFFIYSTVLILLVTATAKLVSANGSARILNSSDPLLRLSIRHTLLVVAGVELAIASILFLSTNRRLKLVLIAWLATIFLVYRLGLIWLEIDKPCWCLGNITDALRLSQATVELVMMGLLTYLLAFSYALLFVDLWHGRHSAHRSHSVTHMKEVAS